MYYKMFSLTSLTAALVIISNASAETSFQSIANEVLNPIPEMVSGANFPGILGQALIDFDNDGDLDIYVTNGPGLANYLYLNDGNGLFTDVAEEAGVTLTSSYTTSVGAGDFDNDGFIDLLVGRQATDDGAPAHPLFLKNMGKNREGIPTFVDFSQEVGFTNFRDDFRALAFATADFNNDGRLDVFIGAFDLTESGEANLPTGSDDPNALMMNVGNFGLPKFVNTAEEAGVAGVFVNGADENTADVTWRPHTWVTYASDVNRDGFQDIFVLNEVPGGVEIYLNNGDASFTLSQADTLYKPGGWMGVASGDYNRDGYLDYFLTNLGAQLGTFGLPPGLNISSPVSEGGTHFHFLLDGSETGELTDVAAETNITPSSVLAPLTLDTYPGLQAYEFGWGASFFDANNDGLEDLYWVGASWAGIPLFGIGRYLENLGDNGFADLTAEVGLFNTPPNSLSPNFEEHENGYGMLTGDLDSDGDQDIVIVNGSDGVSPLTSAGIRILKNETENGNRQLTISLRKTGRNKFGVGSKIELFTLNTSQLSSLDLNADPQQLRQAFFNSEIPPFIDEILMTTSAFSATQPQAVFGLGDYNAPALLKVTWPDGVTTFRIVRPFTSNVLVNRR